jgi:glutathione S-transferase
MKLYTSPASPNCQKVLAVAREVGIDLERIDVDIFKGEARSPAYLAKNPNGRVPLLEDDGLLLWESNAILCYLAGQQPSSSLLPAEPRQRADVDRWLFWQSAHLSPAVSKVAFEKIVKPLTRQGTPDDAVIAAGTAEFQTLAKVLDATLAGREYVAGKLSIADFAIGPFLGVATTCGMDLTPHRHLRGWIERMTSRESVRQTKAAAQAPTRG